MVETESAPDHLIDPETQPGRCIVGQTDRRGEQVGVAETAGETITVDDPAIRVESTRSAMSASTVRNSPDGGPARLL